MLMRLLVKIGVLCDRNSWHRKRGYRIRDQSTQMVGCALAEESVELLAELLDENSTIAAVTEEAADVLVCLTRIIYEKGINLDRLEQVVHAKLKLIWTDDPSKVTANKPGFTRRGRHDQNSGSQ